MLVTGEFGTDQVLKANGYDATIGALTMISKRIENGEEIQVDYLYKWVVNQLQKNPEKKYG